MRFLKNKGFFINLLKNTGRKGQNSTRGAKIRPSAAFSGDLCSAYVRRTRLCPAIHYTSDDARALSAIYACRTISVLRAFAGVFSRRVRRIPATRAFAARSFTPAPAYALPLRTVSASDGLRQANMPEKENPIVRRRTEIVRAFFADILKSRPQTAIID